MNRLESKLGKVVNKANEVYDKQYNADKSLKPDAEAKKYWDKFKKIRDTKEKPLLDKIALLDDKYEGKLTKDMDPYYRKSLKERAQKLKQEASEKAAKKQQEKEAAKAAAEKAAADKKRAEDEAAQKAAEEKAAKQKADQEAAQKADQEAKTKAIKEGDIKAIRKYMTQMTTNEQQDALNRIRNMDSINKLYAEAHPSALKRIKTGVETLSKMADPISKAVKAIKDSNKKDTSLNDEFLKALNEMAKSDGKNAYNNASGSTLDKTMAYYAAFAEVKNSGKKTVSNDWFAKNNGKKSKNNKK